MPSKEETKKQSYFKLPMEDRLDFELEDNEKAKKEIAAEKVFTKLNNKHK